MFAVPTRMIAASPSKLADRAEALSCCIKNALVALDHHHPSHPRLNQFPMQSDGTRRNNKFESDGGMFDALILRPQIPVVMIMSCLAIAIGWILLLRKFARTVVYVSELVKVAALIYIGVKSENAFFFVCAGGYVAYAVYIRKKLDFAARIIKHSSNGQTFKV